MLKTELMLLLQTDGRPTMTMVEVAGLLHVEVRTLQNRIYGHRLPFPMFKVGDSGEWVAHVSDVAAHIDQSREEAKKEFKLAA